MRSWISIVRVIWVLVALLGLVVTAASVPLLLEHYHTLCTKPADVCLGGSQLTPESLRTLEAAGLSLGFYATLLVVVETFSRLAWVVTGALVFLLRSRDRMALWWLSFSWHSGRRRSPPTVWKSSSRPIPPGGFRPAGCRSRVRCLSSYSSSPSPTEGSCRAGRPGSRWLSSCFRSRVICTPLYSGSPLLGTAQGLVFMFCVLGMIGVQVYRYLRVSTPAQR